MAVRIAALNQVLPAISVGVSVFRRFRVMEPTDVICNEYRADGDMGTAWDWEIIGVRHHRYAGIERGDSAGCSEFKLKSVRKIM